MLTVKFAKSLKKHLINFLQPQKIKRISEFNTEFEY